MPATRQRGFTLLELLVVVSIVAMASAGVAFAMRDSTQTRTEQEALRLAALLESARAQSRMRGVPVIWHSTSQAFRFEGLPQGVLPEGWLDANTTVTGSNALELGPDPIIAAQSVTLGNRQQPGLQRIVSTDGLRPFSVHTVADALANAPLGSSP